jgi:MFS transporter, ACS family, D-galactonate transporter
MFLGIAINYLDRVNISHSIVIISRETGITPTRQGIVLSSFSFGYVLFMFVGGLLSDRYGYKIINGTAVFLLSICTIITGFTNGFIGLFIARFFVGVFEAPVFPANAKAVSQLFLPNERGKATAFFDAGSYIGSAFAAPFILFIIVKFGWRISFICSGVIGLFWCYFWLKKCKEKKTAFEKVNQKINWNNFIKSKKIWGICFGFFCYNYLKNFFLTWFPSYLILEKGYTFLKVGMVALIPPFCAILGELITGAITDKLISNGVSVTYARKIPLCVGMICSAIIILSYYTENTLLVILFLSLSYAFLISASPSIWAIPADISPSPDMIGTIGGFQNTFSNIAGIIAPIITGFLFEQTGSFLLPLLVSSGLAILGALSYWFIVGELEPIHL